MATDVTEHQNLKAYGKKVLLSLGFTEQEIQEEYCVKFDGMREKLLVDIVGISRCRKVAIECGNTPSEKMIKLQMYFDEVILLPYLKARVSDLFLQGNMDLAKVIRRNEDEIARLQVQLSDMQKEKERLDTENKRLKDQLKDNVPIYESARDFIPALFISMYLTNPRLALALSSQMDVYEARQWVNTIHSAFKDLENWAWQRTPLGFEHRPQPHTPLSEVIIKNLTELLQRKEMQKPDAKVQVPT